jgi:hypothetical protein
MANEQARCGPSLRGQSRYGVGFPLRFALLGSGQMGRCGWMLRLQVAWNGTQQRVIAPCVGVRCILHGTGLFAPTSRAAWDCSLNCEVYPSQA